jgi:cysteine desulfuration protein SufE
MGASAAVEDEKQRIVDEFAVLGDWVARYEYLVELGNALPPLEDALKTEANRVQGCQSRVWFVAEERDGLIRFAADSDAVLVKGLIALLLRLYSGRTAEDILATSPAFFERIELGSHLTGSRANGLAAMVKRIQSTALGFRAGRAQPATTPVA